MTVGRVGLRDDRPILLDTTRTGGVLTPRRLRKLQTPTLREPSAHLYRREITRYDPLAFALTYLPHHMTLDRGDHLLISPAEWHLDAFGWIAEWANGGPIRHFVAAPREGAKTTIHYVIGLLWAVAHGHTDFALAFAHNAGQVEGHLLKVHAELVGNPYGLLDDFPDLVPIKATTRDIVTRGGTQISARGMDATSLGISSAKNARPGLILLDDIQPDAEHYSMGMKGKRLGTLLNAVLPMNTNAVVMWTGTTVMANCLAHDLVRHARHEVTATWIAETGFTAHHVPAILDEGTASERSFWPQRFPLRTTDGRKGLLEMKYPSWPDKSKISRQYALNYDNRPDMAGGLYWTRDDIRHTPLAISSSYVLSIDTAVTQGPASDMTALCIMGQAPDGRHLTVEWTWAGRITGTELRNLVHDVLRENPTLKDVVIDGNNGGDRWLDILNPPEKPLPRDIKVTVGRQERRGSKRNRLEWLADQYGLGLITHRRHESALEEQMLAYPKIPNDDLLDCVEVAAAYFLGLPIQ